ncbi:MAG: hypothetical protein WAL80_22335 [Xanthobacteraceae bacterium]|jgi:hypothetical protein
MTDLLGYIASCAVLATFLMRNMVPLRLVAILSNVLFLAFGYMQHIYPVFFLHMALLPINAWRLVAAQWRGAAQPGAPLLSVRAARVRLAGAPRPYAFWFALGLMAGLAGALTAIVVTNGEVTAAAGERSDARYSSAPAPACATCSSSCDCTPETPMAPTHSF